ncbi:23S rRNA (pseudouridine(1915)-N(3))-methyltransferase RlmH [Aurantivibrio infirmus]
MKILLTAIGTKMPTWVSSGVLEYQKRLPKEFSIEVKEIPLAHRGKTASVQQAKDQEAEKILSTVQEKQCVVALDSRGKQWNTEQLAEQIEKWQMDGRDLNFLVGGPDGLSQKCIQRADTVWSLSALTLPHPLVRVVIVEQLYRAWSLLNNHPYHK